MTDQPTDSPEPTAGALPTGGNPPVADPNAWSSVQQYPFHPQGAYGGYPPAGSYVQDGPYAQYLPGQHPAGAQQAGFPQAGYVPGAPYAPYGQAGYPPAGYGVGGYGSGGYGAGGYGYGSGGYGSGGYGAGGYPPGPDFWAPPPVPAKPRSHRLVYGSVAAAVAAALAIGGIALAVDHANSSSNQQTSLSTPTQQGPLSGNGSDGSGLGLGGDDGLGNGNSGGSGATGATGQASTAQQVGIVDINTTLNYGQGKAAGTGLVLTSNGEILTNNHVVQDSTALSVTVVSTGKTYSGKVVGTDPTDDVAVIQLSNASGLATAKLGSSVQVAVGNAVTAVGNAGGTGGTPTAASGTISALNQSITASDGNGTNAERLTGMIQVNANIQPGDSGGALYDNATASIIGMNTAASSASGRFGGSAATTGFAIPIAKATGIADQIESGVRTSTIHIGYPAFLGVQLAGAAQDGSGAATISGVIKGTAADSAGLAAGDTITSVDGKAIASATALSAATKSHRPGDQLKIGYLDSSGNSHTVTVTLGSGPAD